MAACVVAFVGGREENHSTTGATAITKTKWVDATLDNPYLVGGDVLDVSAIDVGNEFTTVWSIAIVGRPTITDTDVILVPIPEATGDPALAVIRAIDGSTGAEMGAVDLSGEVVRLKIEGN